MSLVLIIGKFWIGPYLDFQKTLLTFFDSPTLAIFNFTICTVTNFLIDFLKLGICISQGILHLFDHFVTHKGHHVVF